MRLWTVHPKFLEAKGLVALWREGLLAKAVLEDQTKGYRNHPQLIRLRAHPHPLAAMCEYLRGVLEESRGRGFHFNKTKLPSRTSEVETIEDSKGQLTYEWQHFLKKLSVRDADRFRRISDNTSPKPHPLFTIVAGEISSWKHVGKKCISLQVSDMS